MNYTDLPTPAFLVDRSRVQQNCDRMRAKAQRSNVAFRPHVKTHKTVEIAKMQHGGAIGPVTVSTIAEAEFLASAGFSDITYAVPIAPQHLGRAAELGARLDRLNVLIDSETALDAMEARHLADGATFDVFLKIDCGYHRAGVDPKRTESFALARRMAASCAVRFRGLLTHAGHSYNATNIDDVIRIAAEEVSAVSGFWRKLELGGITGLIRSVGSTPTASVVERFDGCDEVRPGNYVFYDAFQQAMGSCRSDEVAVSVLATVIGSYPERKQAIVDAGALALSKDAGAIQLDARCGYGTVCSLDLEPLPMRLVALSQEHGKVECTGAVPPVGTRLRIMPNHSCLTAAMFDRYHVIDGDEVTDEWRPARGW
jgi:D-serine deaminase-like pyridoxal phosphate-dependent protein